MIELTLKLDTDKIEAAIRAAWQQEFMSPDSYRTRDGGTGWIEVVRQVKEHIKTLDLSEHIAKVAKERIENVVDEVVTNMLREAARKRAMEMKKAGTLLLEKDKNV